MTSENFKKALPHILRWEGGFVHHPADPGGATNKGVIQATYNTYRKREGLPPRSVRYITNEEVEDIYYSMYWKNSKHNLDALPYNLALTVFDWHVNSGRGMTTLQSVLGLKADGMMGHMTLNEVKYWQNKGKLKKLIELYNDAREVKYRTWGQGSQRVFLKGWLNRLNNIRKLTEV